MKHTDRLVVLHEPHPLRRQLYSYALQRSGIRVAMAETLVEALPAREGCALILVSLSDFSEERRRALLFLQRSPVSIPLAVLDSESYNPELFSSLPMQAHFHRSATSLSDVVARIEALLGAR